MNIWSKILFSLCLTLSAQAWASGCGGLTDLHIGKHIQQFRVSGEFSCRALGANSFYCLFSSAPLELFTVGAVTPYAPPTGVKIELPVDVFEASMFDDCDGSEVKGVLKKSYHTGTIYQDFQSH